MWTAPGRRRMAVGRRTRLKPLHGTKHGDGLQVGWGEVGWGEGDVNRRHYGRLPVGWTVTPAHLGRRAPSAYGATNNRRPLRTPALGGGVAVGRWARLKPLHGTKHGDGGGGMGRGGRGEGDVNRRRSGRPPVGWTVTPAHLGRRAPSAYGATNNRRPLRTPALGGGGGGAADEAKASTRNQAWRWAAGRMGCR